MASSKKSGFANTYARRLVISDTFAIAIAIFVAYMVMFDDITSVAASAKSEGLLRITLNAPARAWAMGLFWLVALKVFNTRDHRIVGSETEEYKRVFNASASVLGLLALASLFLKLDVSRLFISYSLMAGTAMLVISRWIWRRWLRRQRRLGNYRDAVAISGPAGLVTELVQKLRKDPTSTFTPTLIVAIKEADVAKFMPLGIPVTTSFDDPAALLAEQGIEVLILAGSDNLSGNRFKSIAWNLEGSDIDLIVAPGLVEASTPRVHTRLVSGISFLEVESPTFEGGRFAAKQTFDIVASLLLILIFSPVLFITALAVKLSDRGPIFFSQERHGRNGEIFRMIKFRSMRVGAEKQHEELKKLSESELVNTNMFKLPNDPRITKVGKFIRRYSIDELPQLFNVLKGDMSLVGPRPPLPSEVKNYETHVHRRLLVKPGITGIWQVSGRASLSWEETIRLDLDYVENWSFTGDLFILLKTVGAVFGKGGAF